MKRRRKLLLSGQTFPCIEIRYKHRGQLQVRTAICIACYVTLPKVYHCAAAEFGDCSKIATKAYPGMIYSFFIIPVRSRSEAVPILALLEREKILTFA